MEEIILLFNRLCSYGSTSSLFSCFEDTQVI